ncbi:MAG TPA: DUF1326 domain-containing protein [Thermoanaerobaculia bacterium]|nr:DUF1326 domain-containing protein [Thermoanaerobaculia bacterium]
MSRKIIFLTILTLGLAAAAASATEIRGDYIESRSADVYTGSCFANGEVNLVGNQALVAWKIGSGSWQGVPLDGLVVAGAVRASATLGDPYANPYPAKSVLLVDERATPKQRQALAAFAREMGGKLLSEVVEVEALPMSMVVEREGHHDARASFKAGQIAALETRPIGDKDHFCGNETTFYPPLTETSHAMPAVALEDQYRGPGLGVSWSCSEKRSAFVGTFER